MTQPAQQPPAAPPSAPAAPVQGQPAQPAPPSAPPQMPAPPAQPQAPINPYGYAPPTPPQQPAAPQAWPQMPGQPPAQPPPAMPYLPPPAVPPAEPSDDGQGYDLARLPKAAREEIEQLRAAKQQYNTQLRTAAVSHQAYLIAPQLGANPQALVGSTAWQQAAAQLDPAAPDYQQRLTWTIQAIVQANPWLAAPATSGTSPAQPGGGAPQPGQPAPGAPPAQPAGPTVAPITGTPTGVDNSTPGMGRLRSAYGN